MRWIIAALFLLAVPSLAGFASADDARPGPRDLAGAPDFQFQASDGSWRSLRDLRAEGHVLLVFEPSDGGLAALQRDADSLRAGGVRPVAVFHGSEADNWAKIERLGLTYSLLSDPRGELAAGFRIAGPGVPSWCLVDRDGRMRAMGRGAFPPDIADATGPALEPGGEASALGAPRP